MQDGFPWLVVLESLAKLAAAAGLFAYLLHRAGLGPRAVTTVILAHVVAVFCVMPWPAEFVFAATITLGTCSYALLAVDRPRLRTGIVAACFIIFGALLAQASVSLLIAALILLAIWTAIMVMIRDWARSRP
jgi:hypothetical protein